MTIQRFKADPGRQWDKRVRSDPLFKVLLELSFQHENRIRVLEGKKPITRQQALNAFKQRLQAVAP